jgi:hypothetical protein
MSMNPTTKAMQMIPNNKVVLIVSVDVAALTVEPVRFDGDELPHRRKFRK